MSTAGETVPSSGENGRSNMVDFVTDALADHERHNLNVVLRVNPARLAREAQTDEQRSAAGEIALIQSKVAAAKQIWYYGQRVNYETQYFGYVRNLLFGGYDRQISDEFRHTVVRSVTRLRNDVDNAAMRSIFLQTPLRGMRYPLANQMNPIYRSEMRTGVIAKWFYGSNQIAKFDQVRRWLGVDEKEYFDLLHDTFALMRS